MIKLYRVTKIFRSATGEQKILDNVSYTFYEGKIYVLSGVSGSGKTTLLNILGLLDFDYEGRYRINGVDADKKSANKIRDQWIFYVYQKPITFERLDYIANINLPRYLKRDELDATTIDSYLAKFQLRISQKKNMLTFSGGETQRICLCRGLLADRRVLLLDEATGALDKKNKEIVAQILTKYKENRIVILATHDEKFIRDFADVVLKIKDGKIKTVPQKRKNEPTRLPLRENPPLRGKFARKVGVSLFKANRKRAFSFATMLAGGLAGLCLSLTLCQSFLAYFEKSVKKDVPENVYALSKKNEGLLNKNDIAYFQKKYGGDGGLVCDITRGVYCEKETGTILISRLTAELGVFTFQFVYDESLAGVYEISADAYDKLGEIKHLTFLDYDRSFTTVFSKEMVIAAKGDVIKTKDKSFLDFLDVTSGEGEVVILYVDKAIDLPVTSPYRLIGVYQAIYEPLKNVIGGFRKGIVVFCGISLFISLSGVSTIGVLDTLDRKKQIGLLQSLGWSKKDIRRVLITETGLRGVLTLIFSLISTVFGVILTNAALSATLGEKEIVVSFNISTFATLTIAIFVLTLLSGIAPFRCIMRNEIGTNLQD